MTVVLKGVRVLEVAEHTFVPAASALLADWGAEVIKVEHVTRGDAMRGLASTGVFTTAGDVHALIEHSNRGQEEPRSRPHFPRRAGGPLQAGFDLGHLSDQQAAECAEQAEDRCGGDPRPQPEHHLCPGYRPGRTGA